MLKIAEHKLHRISILLSYGFTFYCRRYGPIVPPALRAYSMVDKFINNGSTVNLCAIDISKAFDRINHHGLFIKVMQRSLPSNLLSVFENWFDQCFTCVRWGTRLR